jgi:hypothetical protein
VRRNNVDGCDCRQKVSENGRKEQDATAYEKKAVHDESGIGFRRKDFNRRTSGEKNNSIRKAKKCILAEELSY